MRNALLLIQNIASMNQVPEEVADWIEDVSDILTEMPERS